MVILPFWLLAAAMLLAALILILRPLLRKQSAPGASIENGPQSKLLLPIVLGLLIPLAAIALYRQVGEPRALDPLWRDIATLVSTTSQNSSSAEAAPDLEQAVARLTERLRDEPEDLQGWMLLGRAHKMLGRFPMARDAFANAYRLAPEHPEVLVEYAESQVLAAETHRFDAEARTLLDRALALQPENQHGLWLLGVAFYQAEDYTQAASIWERLLALLPADAEPSETLRARIAEARAHAEARPQSNASGNGGNDATASVEQATSAPAPRITVTIDVATELKSQVSASDVLFVFARAADGPRMPLAIQRLATDTLPVTVTLDDTTSMMPGLKLSTVAQIVVGARISKSGQATPQPGDLEAFSAPIANTQREPIELVIDRVLP